MQHRTIQGALSRVALSAALAAACLSAQAGDVVATASRNLQGQLSNNSAGSSTSAYWPNPTTPDAFAVVTRTEISATSAGLGSATFDAAAASGHSWTSYTLWDLSTDSALDFAQAVALDLRFAYRVSGNTVVPPLGTSVATASFRVELYSNVVNAEGADLSVVFGPVAPFPSEDYLYTGDMRLWGAYDFGFSVLHENAAQGFMWMAFGNSAAKAGYATGTLSLLGITLADGTLPAGGLGVKLETGEIIPVSAVPEPATWMLWLSAGLWAMGRTLRERRGARSLPGR